MTALRSTLGALTALAVLSLAAWAFGLEPGPALLLGLCLLALFGLRKLPGTNPDEAWPTPPETGSDQGVRREVARLSWSLHGHESRVERPSLLRLRALAEHRLALQGLSLDEPTHAAACQAQLGPTTYATLTAGPRAHITFDEFSRSLTAVGRLGDQLSDPPDHARPRSHRG